MLKSKKNLFSIGLAFSIILGVAFSFVPQEVGAYVRMEETESGKIPCDSNSRARNGYTYTSCSTCIENNGEGYNSGKCS